MLEQQAMMIQQSQKKQELDRIEKKEEIMKMNISNLDPISATYFQNRRNYAKEGFWFLINFDWFIVM